MKDRNVQHASRFRLTKVPGTDDVYDLIPAPGEVYEEGTLINKYALLKDATAALFGLDDNAVPDDALSKLSGLYQHYWYKYNYTPAGYTLGNATEVSWSQYNAFTVYYSDSVVVDSNGNVSLSNPSTIDIPYNNNNAFENVMNSTLPGKFFYLQAGYIYYRTNTATSANYAAEARLVSGYAQSVGERIGFATASESTAYPTPSGGQDGFYYVYLGVPFDNAVTAPEIATGSYTGTGTYGSSNMNSLTFDFEPKIVFIGDVNGWFVSIIKSSYYNSSYDGYSCQPLVLVGADYSSQYQPIKRISAFINGNTMRWFSDETRCQLNTNSNTYEYIAIG